MGSECWDVCNPEHTPQEYQIGSNAAINSGFAGLVSQVRAGLNSFIQCPGPLATGDRCPPGRLCGRFMLEKFDIPRGRGMCVVDSSKPSSRACWDMCDLHHKPEDYTIGTAAGVAQHIWEVRQGGCPSAAWWPWILAALLSVCVLTCCAYVVMVLTRMGKKRTRGMGTLERGASRLEASPGDFSQDYLEPTPPPAFADERGLPPEDYRDDYRREYGMREYSDPEEYRMPDPPGPIDVERSMQESLPPEPPRMDPPPQPREYQVPQQELPAPPSDPRLDLFERIDTNHDGKISRDEYENFFPGSRQSMRIPGLDEPNLLFPSIQPPSIQPLVVPQTTAQVAPPDLLSQAVQRNPFLSPGDPLGGSQPQVMTPFRMTTGSSNPAFQTQLPAAFATQLPFPTVSGPPGSVQLRPGSAPSPGGQTFFTQLSRR